MTEEIISVRYPGLPYNVPVVLDISDNQKIFKLAKVGINGYLIKRTGDENQFYGIPFVDRPENVSLRAIYKALGPPSDEPSTSHSDDLANQPTSSLLQLPLPDTRGITKTMTIEDVIASGMLISTPVGLPPKNVRAPKVPKIKKPKQPKVKKPKITKPKKQAARN